MQKSVKDTDKAVARRIAAREAYRERNNVTFETCIHNLDRMEEIAKVEVVDFPNGKVKEIPVFHLSQLGQALDTSEMSLNRWLKANMLPAPVIKAGRGKVYSLEEAKSIVRIIGEHQAEMKQYRTAHVDTRDRLFDENTRIRKFLFHKQ